MNTTDYRKMIDDFENHYNYDSTYMRDLLESSLAGYEKFSNFLPLARHRERLGTEAYWVAKLSAMQVGDCGDCLQLNIRMALESGVEKPVIESVLNGGDTLPAELNDIYHYAKQIASNDSVAPELLDRISERYDKGDLLEFGLCIAAGMVFPVMRRAAGYAKSCSVMEIEV